MMASRVKLETNTGYEYDTNTNEATPKLIPNHSVNTGMYTFPQILFGTNLDST
jgi:hypothetical protein